MSDESSLANDRITHTTEIGGNAQVIMGDLIAQGFERVVGRGQTSNLDDSEGHPCPKSTVKRSLLAWTPYLYLLGLLCLPLGLFYGYSDGKKANHITGFGPQNINAGRNNQIYHGGSGDAVFNFVQPETEKAKPTKVYAYSSIRTVSNYVSRPKLEQSLRDRLFTQEDNRTQDETRTVLIWGLGGAGKTQLASNYARKYQQRYHTVFWVEAGQKQSVERDFVQIYKTLFPEAIQSNVAIDVEDAVGAVKGWLFGQDERSLWIMDGADMIDDEKHKDFIDLNHYIPQAPYLDIIITTRSSRLQSLSFQKSILVADMAEEEAVQVFRNYSNLHEASYQATQEIKTIVRELGYLALAVTLAGSYVNENHIPPHELHLYLAKYRAQRARILGRKAHINIHQYNESVIGTWEVSFSAIAQRSPLAAQLLGLLASINHDNISPHLFVIGEKTERQCSIWHVLRQTIISLIWRWGSPPVARPCAGPWKAKWLQLLSRADVSVDNDAIDSAFGALESYSFLSWQVDQRTYTMHKLVHAWGHDRLEVSEQQAWTLAALELLGQVAVDKNKDITSSEQLVPHVMANFGILSKICGSSYWMTTEERASIVLIGDFLRELGRWDDEYQVRVLSMQVTELVLGQVDPETWVAGSDLANVLSQQGMDERAEHIFRTILDVSTKLLEKDHPLRLTLLNNFAGVLKNRGKYKQAEEVFLAIEFLMTKAGDSKNEMLTNSHNLATVIGSQGRYEEAEKIHRCILRQCLENCQRNSPMISGTMNSLALMLIEQGKYQEAEEILEEALQLDREVRGPKHPATLNTQSNLASTLSYQHKYEKATEMNLATLDLVENSLGPANPLSLASRHNLATLWVGQGRYEQAEKLLWKQLEMSEKIHGKDHPHTLMSLTFLAIALSGQGRHEQAENLLEMRERRAWSAEVNGVFERMEDRYLLF